MSVGGWRGDLEDLLEAIILLYIENTEAIISAYIEPESQGRGGSFMPDLLGRMQATTTSPDSGMMMASSQTSQGNALLSSPTRPADVAYNYALAELNPIRYRGYYRDAETGFYFCQTRYYNPQWRRFINADCLFVAGSPLTASNMYAYCDGNPVRYCDPSGMAIDAGTAAAGWATTMWWLTLIDGPLPIGDLAYLLGIGAAALTAGYAIYKQLQAIAPYIEMAAALISSTVAVTRWINSINWNPEPNRKNHIINGTNNQHINGWKKFGFDPKGDGGWEAIVALIQTTVLAFDSYRSWQDNGGMVWEYTKVFATEGVRLVVTLFHSAQGIWSLVDAKPFII